jgi:hypothetical protein
LSPDVSSNKTAKEVSEVCVPVRLVINGG